MFLSVAYENHCLPCNYSVFGLLKGESLFLISASGSCFLFWFTLLFVSRCSFVLVFCLFSCFALNHNIRFFALLRVFLLLLFLGFVALVFVILEYVGYLSKHL